MTPCMQSKNKKGHDHSIGHSFVTKTSTFINKITRQKKNKEEDTPEFPQSKMNMISQLVRGKPSTRKSGLLVNSISPSPNPIEFDPMVTHPKTPLPKSSIDIPYSEEHESL